MRMSEHSRAESIRQRLRNLIITISDPEEKVRVYDEMALIVRNRFQAQNVNIRTSARIQARQGGHG